VGACDDACIEGGERGSAGLVLVFDRAIARLRAVVGDPGERGRCRRRGTCVLLLLLLLLASFHGVGPASASEGELGSRREGRREVDQPPLAKRCNGMHARAS
jgi:hypothetical protein